MYGKFFYIVTSDVFFFFLSPCAYFDLIEWNLNHVCLLKLSSAHKTYLATDDNIYPEKKK